MVRFVLFFPVSGVAVKYLEEIHGSDCFWLLLVQ